MKRSVKRLRRVETYCLLRALEAPTNSGTAWWADRHSIADHELNIAIAHSCDRGARMYLEVDHAAHSHC
jgi:hypothetical protein